MLLQYNINILIYFSYFPFFDRRATQNALNTQHLFLSQITGIIKKSGFYEQAKQKRSKPTCPAPYLVSHDLHLHIGTW